MKITIIGAGAMGGALTSGLLLNDSGIAGDIVLSDIQKSVISRFSSSGVTLSESNIEAVADADLIVVAVKPWLVKNVIREIEPHVKKTGVEWAFILAGVTSENLMQMFDKEIPSELSLVMPNTAMAVGQSMTFLVSVNGENERAMEIFDKVGKVLKIEERQLPAAMALASCGIAFAMRYVRASSLGGVELGFKASAAQEIVCETLKGAVALLSQTGAHPATEIDKVTTPGGITIKGLNEMEKYGFSTSVIEGLKACK